MEAMLFVGLDFEEFRARSPFELSGGQKRRVAIAGDGKEKVVPLSEVRVGDVMIIYGTVTEDFVDRLFIASIVPGLILAGLFILYAVIRSKRGGFTPMPRTTWSERFSITVKNIWGILLPFIIIGGIYSGAFTPTEAAAVGLVYSLFVTVVVYRTIKVRDIPGICLKSVPSLDRKSVV